MQLFRLPLEAEIHQAFCQFGRGCRRRCWRGAATCILLNFLARNTMKKPIYKNEYGAHPKNLDANDFLIFCFAGTNTKPKQRRAPRHRSFDRSTSNIDDDDGDNDNDGCRRVATAPTAAETPTCAPASALEPASRARSTKPPPAVSAAALGDRLKRRWMRAGPGPGRGRRWGWALRKSPVGGGFTTTTGCFCTSPTLSSSAVRGETGRQGEQCPTAVGKGKGGVVFAE